MAETLVVRPDRKFVEEIIASGGGDLKHCMQCATCSVACELSDGRPFPRKEMIWAQWGLKDHLFADPDVWLCHQCNDCSKRCPRGARPGDVLAAVRRRTIEHYAFPRALARWVNRPAFLPLLLLAPALLLGLALLARDPVQNAFGFHEHPGFYADFFPHWLLIAFFGFFTTLALVVAAAGVIRFWRAMKAEDAAAGGGAVAAGILASLGGALGSILTHDRFGRCEAQASRRVVHLALFYGFLALYVVTLWAVVDIYVMPALGVASRYPFDLAHPMKVLANVGGVVMIFGAAKAMTDRRRPGAGTPAGTAFDWVFVWLVMGVGVTGFAAEVFRFTVGPEPGAALTATAYAVYFAHLVLVFQLLVYLPYSKFAHVLYRTVAMVYAERTGRNPPARRRPPALRAAPHRPAVHAGGSPPT
ncbi:MAG TPA: quinone-interacting membrane-bound oxidoreductase complex subunit QmoC [Longimicrobiales bacterium]|nr:quinone-interacting membrane-bound oxidoreductase complex subunit QmoC [Longimicrobiales bacterium]